MADVEMADNIEYEEIKKIVKIVNIIILELGPAKSAEILTKLTNHEIDLDVSNEIACFFMNIYKCLMTEVNDAAGHNEYKIYDAKIAGMTLTVQKVIDKIKNEGIVLNFLIATPIVDIMTLFKNFFDEVRTGLARFKVSNSALIRIIKRDNTGIPVQHKITPGEATQYISEYGLGFHHIPLLHGITLAPELRTRIFRCLGPLTQCILIVMGDKNYSKLSDALLMSLQMLPMAREVVKNLKEAVTPRSVSQILNVLGDILLLTPRSTQKAYMPLLLVKYMWDRKNHMPGFNWSFSETGIIKMYCRVASEVKFAMKSGADELQTSQVVFHAMFGTYLEDLCILSQITSHGGEWQKRKDLNEVFIRRDEKQQVIFTPISFKYVSKMENALLTKSLGNVDPMATSRPSFSGYRKRNLGFISYRVERFSEDPIQLLNALRKLKNQLVEDKDNVKMVAGTKTWEKLVGDDWVPDNFAPVEGSIKFFGN